MANKNPIKLANDGVYTSFTIPKKFAQKMLQLSTSAGLEEGDEWNLDTFYTVNLDGDPVAVQPNPDLNKQELGICADLEKLKLSVVCIATRTGGSGSTPKVTYKLVLEGDDEQIDAFSLTGDEVTPTTFYAKITLVNEK